MKIVRNNFLLLAIGIGIFFGIATTVSSDVKKEGRRRRLGGSLPPGITIAATAGLGERQLDGDGSLSSSLSMKTIAIIEGSAIDMDNIVRGMGVEILMQHL